MIFIILIKAPSGARKHLNYSGSCCSSFTIFDLQVIVGHQPSKASNINQQYLTYIFIWITISIKIVIYPHPHICHWIYFVCEIFRMFLNVQLFVFQDLQPCENSKAKSVVTKYISYANKIQTKYICYSYKIYLLSLQNIFCMYQKYPVSSAVLCL